MKVIKRGWALATLCGIRKKINTEPGFQRPAVWTKSQKQLLIDTILRDYDVPKLYWRKTGVKPESYDVVDGQQRLRAIWEFHEGAFALPSDADDIDGDKIANKRYEELADELRNRFDVYNLDIITLEEIDDDEVREMFLRLQNGTSLKAQEKRNAYPGKMRTFVRDLAQQEFFKKVGFANSRFAHDHVAAQLMCLELAAKPTNIKNADLNRMYKQHSEFDQKSSDAKAVRRVVDLLNGTFVDKTPELERYNVIALYCVVAEVMRQYVLDDVTKVLYRWFLDFESRRRAQDERPEDSADPEWLIYREKISHSTDSADSVRHRMEFMLRDLLEHNPSIRRKDNQRDFTKEQRLTVFRRDHEICQLRLKCDGSKLEWDDWHCDHRAPWSKGGATTVENGQASCTPCNLAKSADENPSHKAIPASQGAH